jgi:para-nitrobenzyl esterase
MGPIVETSRGRLRGVHENGLYKFRGVPYAQPPIGELRFRPPRRARPWAGELDATQFGAAAPQGAEDPLPLRNDITRWSEDCLRLNIWTPGLDGKRPVMVWFHGGAFVRGTASRPVYDRGVLPLGGEVVVVAVEYRLGALGFLHVDGLSGTEGPFGTNLGIRDQLSALQWVHEEIAEFGGDPENVTAFGHSAGAVSLGAMLSLPATERVFRRAILQSGPPTAISADAAGAVAAVLLENLGLTRATAERLRDIPVETILAAQPATWKCPGSRPLGVPFAPVIDGDLIERHPLESIADGAAREVAIITGTTTDEVRPYLVLEPDLINLDEAGLHQRCAEIVLAPSTAIGDLIAAYRDARLQRGAGATPCDLWLAILADRFVRCGSTKVAELQSAAGATAYSYLFNWQSPFMNGWLGAFHELELPFLFGYLDDQVGAMITGDGPERAALAQRVQSAWTAFARGGVPTADGTEPWPRYDRAARATMVLDVECSRRNAPLDEERRAWEKIMPLGFL